MKEAKSPCLQHEFLPEQNLHGSCPQGFLPELPRGTSKLFTDLMRRVIMCAPPCLGNGVCPGRDISISLFAAGSTASWNAALSLCVDQWLCLGHIVEIFMGVVSLIVGGE